MKVDISEGKYIVAVSGGVDSIVLLDLLAKKPGAELVVAHFNHGIRSDAAQDEELVRSAAKRYGLAFEVGHGHLGQAASEAAARTARYRFLEDIKQKHGAKAIITAHQHDDLLETALLNLLRGTGWRGLDSIKNQKDLLRPLLAFDKDKIIQYAKKHQLKWQEDSTNSDERYLRNYIRHQLLPKLSVDEKETLIGNIDKVAKIKPELTKLIATISHQVSKANQIDRQAFSALPLNLSNEVLVNLLNAQKVDDIDSKIVQRLNLAIRNAPAETSHDVKKDLKLKLTQKAAVFSRGQ